jgi:hypothetical protein
LSKNLPRPMLARRFFATRLNGNFANLIVESARVAWAVCRHSPHRMEWLDRANTGHRPCELVNATQKPPMATFSGPSFGSIACNK